MARDTIRPSTKGTSLALASGAVAAFLPKCPICLAAYLSLFGVSIGAASVALEVLRPAAFALAAVSLAFVILRRLPR